MILETRDRQRETGAALEYRVGSRKLAVKVFVWFCYAFGCAFVGLDQRFAVVSYLLCRALQTTTYSVLRLDRPQYTALCIGIAPLY
jgi:hypothetical protein